MAQHFSVGQWPSLAYKAEKKFSSLLTIVVVVLYVISSPSPTFIYCIVCLKLFFWPNEEGVSEEKVQNKRKEKVY